MARTHLIFCACIFLSFTAPAQPGYSNLSTQATRLANLARSYPQFVRLKSITKTKGGKDVYQLTIGSGNTDSKPAIAVVGGVEGSHLLGVEAAIGFAEGLLQQASTDSVRELLNKTTFYIFPNMSPDATEQFFAGLRYERQGNATQTDDDRDGRLNEDGFEDLDGNGKISWMRIESPIGEYRINTEDPRSLIKADPLKGEKGKYLLLSEGMDNDKDGVFNEDGEGGVWFNKNFSFRPPSFSAGAGEFAVSENENRALADVLFELFNVYAVVSFSSNNNLSTPVSFNSAAASQTIVSSWLEPDVRANTMVSDLYNKTVPYKDAPKGTPAGGDFFSWAYYHYGRFSFSTPAWWVPKAKPDTSKSEKAFSNEDPVANYLRWAAQQGITNTFTPWKTYQHPDFPGQTVEVGGLDPFVLNNPPYQLVADIVKRHTSFIIKLAGYQPELDILNLKTEQLSGGITRITASVVNKGALPSSTKLGERSYWIKRITVNLNILGNQTLLSGKKVQLLNSLEGNTAQQFSWLVKGEGNVSVEAGSPTTGTKKIDIKL